MDPQMKKLAKKRAMKDEGSYTIESEKPDVRQFENEKQVKARENYRSGQDAMDFAKGQDKLDKYPTQLHEPYREDDLGDHKTKVKRRKFEMLQTLLGHFDSMDQ